ncbi:MAG: transglycosylase SLT domain-containing protein [Muribaculaceae bacterium]|nr:transglycosylase SLT domain-containing protein [Muribaculaceae bacterium]
MNHLPYKTISAALLIAGITFPAWSDTTVREVNTSAETSQFYPESFETDTHKMLENWYLRNYTELDKSADNKDDIVTSEQEIIERLAAMPTEIEMPYNSIVRSYIDMYTQRRRQLVENMLGLSLYYMPIFEQALDRHGLPLELKYLPVIESALNPSAVSKAGATGLWQFMIPTATGLGLEVSTLVDQRRDPYASSEAAAVYLKQLYETFGDWSLAIAAYNCGPGNVNKALRRAGGGKKDFWEIYPILPAETRSYVPAFIAANYVMTYYNKHNISPALARKPIVTDSVHVNKRVHFNQIADVLAIPVDEIRALNPQYRKDIIPGNVKPSSLVLPSLQVYAYIANEDSILNHNASRYAHRDVVEPATGITIAGSDSKGEYIEEQTVQYHTVARNETLTSIAKKYGVTVSSIRQNNKIGKSVRRGQKLKIITVERHYKEPEILPDSLAAVQVEPSVEPTDSATVAEEVPVKEVKPAAPQKKVTEKVPAAPAKPKADTKKKTSSKATTYKIVSGDNLYKIAKRHGVTVDALKKANGMTNDNIRAGQELKIPAK